MSRLLPLLPFAAALSLLACQNDGPVSDDATAPPDDIIGDASARGLATPANSAAAEAVTRAALPQMSAGMAWVTASDGRSVRFGPLSSDAMLTIACAPGGLIVTRHHPASFDGTATLSFTGGGEATSLPMKAVPTTLGASEAHWQGRADGDGARAIARPFARAGLIEITLGGAPSLVVPAGAEVLRLFNRCAGG